MTVKVKSIKIEDLLFSELKPVLEMRLVYPCVEGHLSRAAEENINSFYMSGMKKTNRYARNVLYPQAAEEYKQSLKEGFPFNLHSFFREYTAPFVGKKFMSIYFDTYTYTGGAHGMTVRTAKTWNLQTGEIVPLKQLFTGGSNFRRYILSSVLKQIADRQKAGDDIFFENVRDLAVTNFNAENFYMISENEIAVFYPLYSIAPYYAGILTFTVPLKR